MELGADALGPAADGDVVLSSRLCGLVGVAVSEGGSAPPLGVVLELARGALGVVLAVAEPLPVALLELAAEADALLLATLEPDAVPV